MSIAAIALSPMKEATKNESTTAEIFNVIATKSVGSSKSLNLIFIISLLI